MLLRPQGKIRIGAVSGADRSPATPTGMRTRTGRLEKLRSREARHSRRVDVGNRQDVMLGRDPAVPPATAQCRHRLRDLWIGAEANPFPARRNCLSSRTHRRRRIHSSNRAQTPGACANPTYPAHTAHSRASIRSPLPCYVHRCDRLVARPDPETTPAQCSIPRAAPRHSGPTTGHSVETFDRARVTRKSLSRSCTCLQISDPDYPIDTQRKHVIGSYGAESNRRSLNCNLYP